MLLMFLGLNPFVTVLAGGFLAVAFSRRRNQVPIPPGSGARLGALTGLFLFAVSTILELLAVVVLHKGAEIRAMAMDKVQQAVARYPSPGSQSLIELAKTPNGFAFLMVGSAILSLLAFVALGSIGGALAASLLGRKTRP